jgi:hypothetical protein
LINYNLAWKLWAGKPVPVEVTLTVNGELFSVHSFCLAIPSTNPDEGYTVIKHDTRKALGTTSNLTP